MFTRCVDLFAVFLFQVEGQEYAACDALALKTVKARIDHSVEPSVERFDDKIGSQRIATVVWGRAVYLEDKAKSKQTYVCLLETDKKAVAFLIAPMELEPRSADDPLAKCRTNMATFKTCVEEQSTELERAMDVQLSAAKRKLQAIEKTTGQMGTVRALQDAQNSWLAYRKSTCALKSALANDGSGPADRARGCVIKMTGRRIEELKSP